MRINSLLAFGALGAALLPLACRPPRPATTAWQKRFNTALHHYHVTQITVDRMGSFGSSAALPYYAVQEYNWLRPHVRRWRERDGIRRKAVYGRYRHTGLKALFNATGKQLTDFAFAYVAGIGHGHLAYSIRRSLAELGPEDVAVWYSGAPQRWRLQIHDDALRLGLLNRAGQRITEPRYVRLLAVGPNVIWAVRADSCQPYDLPGVSNPIEYQLTYGLLDSLGRVVLPFEPGPLSLPDTAGLLRRRNAPALRIKGSFDDSEAPRYGNGNLIRYYRLNGRAAFAGEFSNASPFWQGRALVQVGSRYGIIDTLGRWLTPLDYADLRGMPRTTAQRQHDKRTDPLGQFDPLDTQHKRWWADW